MKRDRLLSAGVLILSLVITLAVPSARAADMTVTASVQTISVGVSTDPIAFGVLVASDSAVASAAITVTNTGNDAATYSLSVANSTNWTAGSAVGADQFSLSCMFNGSQPAMSAFDVDDDRLTTSAVACTASLFAGDETGVNVAAAATRSLWFKFQAPSSSSVQTEETITATVTAAAAS